MQIGDYVRYKKFRTSPRTIGKIHLIGTVCRNDGPHANAVTVSIEENNGFTLHYSNKIEKLTDAEAMLYILENS